jgi:hypothetical protein
MEITRLYEADSPEIAEGLKALRLSKGVLFLLNPSLRKPNPIH